MNECYCLELRPQAKRNRYRFILVQQNYWSILRWQPPLHNWDTDTPRHARAPKTNEKENLARIFPKAPRGTAPTTQEHHGRRHRAAPAPTPRNPQSARGPQTQKVQTLVPIKISPNHIWNQPHVNPDGHDRAIFPRNSTTHPNLPPPSHPHVHICGDLSR